MFAHEMILCLKEPKYFTRKILAWIPLLAKQQGTKINIHKLANQLSYTPT
jgi:hypothetical protein